MENFYDVMQVLSGTDHRLACVLLVLQEFSTYYASTRLKISWKHIPSNEDVIFLSILFSMNHEYYRTVNMSLVYLFKKTF